MRAWVVLPRTRWGSRGHVVFYDFNRDHQEGNGFHGDGVTRRYIDVPFTAVGGTGSGVLVRYGWMYYSDTGTGVVRRMKLDCGSTEVLVDSWAGAHQGAHGAQGPASLSGLKFRRTTATVTIRKSSTNGLSNQAMPL